MVKLISVILLVGFISCPNSYAQPKTFGHKILDKGDIVSTTFLIKDGFVLDSAITNSGTYRFEYNKDGKLSRDINIISYPIPVQIDGHIYIRLMPGYRDYYYNANGPLKIPLI